MHKDMPTGRDPSPAARVGYHSGKGLATSITRRIDATFAGAPGPRSTGVPEPDGMQGRKRKKPAGGGHRRAFADGPDGPVREKLLACGLAGEAPDVGARDAEVGEFAAGQGLELLEGARITLPGRVAGLQDFEHCHSPWIDGSAVAFAMDNLGAVQQKRELHFLHGSLSVTKTAS